MKFIFFLVILLMWGTAAIFFLNQIGAFVIPKHVMFLALERKAAKEEKSASPFFYTFQQDGALEETGTEEESSSRYWWLNSGGQMILQNGVGKTLQGSLPAFAHWRMIYVASAPEETDDGYYPQNIFRLLTRNTWQNIEQEIYVKINRLNMSRSEFRNSTNGILLFARYRDSGNLYYAGVRVDGTAVIKKKINGEYYTLAEPPFFSGVPYDRDLHPNLLPEQVWIGVRSVVANTSGSMVDIKIYVDTGKTGKWVLAAEAQDDGKSYGGRAILEEGYAGIRTDFMDAEFDDYRIRKL